MSSTVLTPTVSLDPSGAWANDSFALGWPHDGLGASATGSGRLALSQMSGRLTIPAGDIPVGFEVELWARTDGPILVNDTFTDTPGTWLHNHDGELNADWRRPFTGVDPSYQGINAQGRTYYAFVNDSGPTNNGAEHFLTNYVPPSADYAVEARIFAATNGGSGERAEIYARATIPYTFYFLQYDEGVDTWYLGVSTGAGSRTNLASYAGDRIAQGSSRTARLAVRGTIITGFIDGVERLSATNGTITGAGYPGLRLDANPERSIGVVVTAAYDLGSPTVVTRFRRRYGTINGFVYLPIIEASNDGVNWIDAWTGGMLPADPSTGLFSWYAEQDFASVTSTPYRYWRTVVIDGGAGGEARIGDFRLYGSGGSLISPSGLIVTRGGHRVGNTPHNWDEMTATSNISDNLPGDNSTWIGGTATANLADEGLQFDSFRVERLLPTTLDVYLSSNGSTPNGTAKTLQLTGTNSYRIVGGPSDLWGGSWTMDEIRAASFSILVERSETLAEPWVDAARVIIYHGPNGGTLMSLREQVRQQILIGRETTLGTVVPANVRLRHARIQPQPAPEFRDHRPAGEKLINHQVVIKEGSEGPIEGIPTYDEMGWLLQGLISRPATSVLSAGAAFRHVFTFDNRVRDGISTYTVEYGDQFSRAHRVAAAIINSLEIGLRQDGMDLSGSIIARELSDGVTMTTGAATVQTLTQSGTGTFALRFRGQETASLTAGAGLTAAAIETALRALPAINSSTQLTVTGSAGGPFTITFGNSAAGPFAGRPQPLLEVRTLSGTPTTSVAMTTRGGHTEYPGQIILPRHVEFFMTPTLASLASAKITEAFVTGFSMGNRAAPVYNLDRGQASWFNYAEPSNIDVNFNLVVHANSNGMSFLPQGRSDTILYLRILATGPNIGATGLPHRLQIDCPVKISEFGPFSENQDVYAFEYGLTGAFDDATNTSLVVTLDNGVTNYD